MLLAYKLVGLESSPELQPYDATVGHQLPSVYMHEAQQVMTRSDFVRQLDRLNIFTITPHSRVRASSVPMQRAFREICTLPGFADHLGATIDRIAAIESLGRTRELVAKDLVAGAAYEIERGIEPPRQRGKKGLRRSLWGEGRRDGVTVRLRPVPEEDEEDGGKDKKA